MELRYRYVVYIGLAIIFVLAILHLNKNNRYSGGKRVASVGFIKENHYIKRKLLTYRIMTVLLLIACFVVIGISSVIVARPYRTSVEDKMQYSRDIILCIDISSSVDELNMDLIDELKDTVNSLHGERFGVVIFNTTPVLLVPLTDDYDYINDTLDTICEALESRNNYFSYSEDWLYLEEYIMEGTLIGSEEVGSSLIGDGLAAAASDFSDIDEERTRIIIFSSDNDIQGTPIFTLDEAATICKEKNIVVYGIGTRFMYSDDETEMREAVELTGGRFFLEEDDGGISGIVDEINSQSKTLIKVDREIRQTDIVDVPFFILLISTCMVVVLTKITKR